MSVKNSTYNVTPVAAMFEECALNLGFSKRKAMKIRQAVEEILLMRVNETAYDIGDIEIALHYMQNHLRITVTDSDMDTDPDREQQRKIASAIVLRFVDDCSMERLENGQYQVRIDFAYDEDFDIKDFLMKHETID